MTLAMPGVTAAKTRVKVMVLLLNFRCATYVIVDIALKRVVGSLVRAAATDTTGAVLAGYQVYSSSGWRHCNVKMRRCPQSSSESTLRGSSGLQILLRMTTAPFHPGFNPTPPIPPSPSSPGSWSR